MDETPEPVVVEAKILEPKKKRKPKIVKVKLGSRPAKYFLARQRGLNKKDAAIEAGYNDNHNQSKIEKTDTFKAIENHYKTALLQEITLPEIAAEHKKNILQDKDRGAKNVAIKMALEKIEPDAPADDDDDKVTVVLRM